ncbi:glycosyltransferase [Paenibacillus arenilitoris]|uniref:Glycosyltransferase n=1 Tax=Paenibacillus arenilitoris TaxID=2772299 RepID=A0A927CQ23_9BACL|nr:glycosyltransferase [Paenibacillus arenilitoris]MBD2871425.1 glycosyltransferase [Paenibacillus arenilitoris]
MSDARIGMTSVIVMAGGEPESAMRCVERVRRHTDRSGTELIAVVNGGAAARALREIGAAVIESGCNEGTAKARNRGIAAASGELVALLDRHAAVTPGWLDALQRGLLGDPRVGAAGPATSRNAGGRLPVAYETEEELELAASALHAVPDRSKREERLALDGSCLLLRRSAYGKAGPFDERFAGARCADIDFGLRLRLAGYALLYCGDVYVHQGEDGPEPRADASLFRQKWGFSPCAAADGEPDIRAMLERASHGYMRGERAIMQIGCGCGASLLQLKKLFPGAAWYGSEPSSKAADVARAAGITVFRPNGRRARPIEAAWLDGIIAGRARAYGKPRALKRLACSLKPNGWLLGRFESRLYSKRRIKKLYRLAGLTGVEIEAAGGPASSWLLAFGRRRKAASASPPK